MASPLTIEVCVDSLQGAQAAEEGGADRLELCTNLQQGGTTPSLGLLAAVRAATSLPVMVMIRPRPGDFCYDALELEVMHRDIAAAEESGADGIVSGALLPSGEVDQPAIAELLAKASVPLTFHRAFDLTPDPRAALEALADLGVARILTSGQQPSAPEGADLLRELIEQAGDRLCVMPGCGINERTIGALLAGTMASEVHFSGRVTEESPLLFRRPNVPMAGPPAADEFLRWITSASKVRSLCDLARKCRQ